MLVGVGEYSQNGTVGTLVSEMVCFLVFKNDNSLTKCIDVRNTQSPQLAGTQHLQHHRSTQPVHIKHALWITAYDEGLSRE